jgi:hypothetical protein
MLGWDWYRFHKKRARTHYVNLVFLYLVGSAGHVVHFSASGARNVDALFFTLGWALCGSIKSATGHVTSNKCFSFRWDMWVT